MRLHLPAGAEAGGGAEQHVAVHEVSKKDPGTDKTIILDRGRWRHFVNTYYPPAGVSSDWTARMKPYTVRSDYWQTGADLVNDHSGIVHEALGNQRPRRAADGNPPAAAPAPAPLRRASQPAIPSPGPCPAGRRRARRPRSRATTRHRPKANAVVGSVGAVVCASPAPQYRPRTERRNDGARVSVRLGLALTGAQHARVESAPGPGSAGLACRR